MDREACCAAGHGVTKSRTLLSDWTELNWEELASQRAPDPCSCMALKRVTPLSSDPTMWPLSARLPTPLWLSTIKATQQPHGRSWATQELEETALCCLLPPLPALPHGLWSLTPAWGTTFLPAWIPLCRAAPEGRGEGLGLVSPWGRRGPEAGRTQLPSWKSTRDLRFHLR